MRRTLWTLLLLIALLGLTACGNKGDLVRPDSVAANSIA